MKKYVVVIILANYNTKLVFTGAKNDDEALENATNQHIEDLEKEGYDKDAIDYILRNDEGLAQGENQDVDDNICVVNMESYQLPSGI